MGLFPTLMLANFKLLSEVVYLFILTFLSYLFRSNLAELSSSAQVKMVVALSLSMVLCLAFRPSGGASVRAEDQRSVG